MKVSLLALGITLIQFTFSPSYANKTVAPASYEDTTYTRVITERAGKIVSTLDLPDSAAFLRVRTIVIDQYRALNAVNTDRDDKKIVQQDVDARIAKLHTDYLAKLATELNPQQIDKVKDGMTYGVVQVTYRAYNQQLPNLNDQQKAYILAALIEAREHAMDAESSKKKHAWFGKYKGRINNYLSSQGISMKK
jgi:hypothetical protein